MTADPHTLSVPEVARVIGVSDATAYRMVASGEIPVIPTTRRVKRVPKVWVETMLARTVQQWQAS